MAAMPASIRDEQTAQCRPTLNRTDHGNLQQACRRGEWQANLADGAGGCGDLAGFVDVEPVAGRRRRNAMGRPEHWLALELETFWFALIAKLALLALMAFFTRALMRLPWGRDLTWTEQGWQATDAAAAWSAHATGAEPPLTESSARVRAVAIVSVPSLMLLTSFAYAMLTVLFGEEPELQDWLLLLLPFTGALVYLVATWLQIKSRCVVASAGGLVDSNFFCTLRVPWSAIGGVHRVGRDTALQNTFQTERHGRHRPVERKMWVVTGRQQGQEILRLGDDMVPARGLVQLRARLGAGGSTPATSPTML
jgi:hypothetical protein